ncbi:MAG: carbon starvation CstA family protein [Candidatus Latescibacterota bacterium]
MNVLAFLLVAIGAFFLASRFYARFIARQIGEDPKHPTPATTINDGRDYVPTRRFVVFAHHFSSIAGAGPILGPTMAILYGFMPAWLWIVFGGIFIGAVHDFTSLFISMREGGKSMAEIARKSLGKAGFNLFIVFTILMIVLVTSSFLSATAISLTSLWPVDKIGVTEGATFLKTVVQDGVVMGKIGGIASTSVIIITLLSPILGWFIYRRGIKTWVAHTLALLICVFSVLLGIQYPVSFSPGAWMIIISIYVTFAAGLPVWMVLQPRDFINAHILYLGIVVMIASILFSGFSGLTISAPQFNLADGVQHLGLIWPMMFITIACGAISGFHSLVSGGTTCKQLSEECDARKVGFTAMLLESTLAICVLIAVGVGLNFVDYKSIVWPTDPGVRSNPILGFSLAAGHLFNNGLGIPVALGTVFGILLVEGFVITTLDTAIRLNRYLFEELWSILLAHPPAFLKHYWFNSGLSVIFMWSLAYSNGFSKLWPIFGAANQLLAALGLVAVSSWLLLKGRRYIFALIPAIFMIVTTFASLIILFGNYLRQKNYVLVATDILLFLMAFGVIFLAARTFLRPSPVAGTDIPS